MMANLQYKTKGNSNPKGKPKIYFCCHIDDFPLYFEEISKDDILLTPFVELGTIVADPQDWCEHYSPSLMDSLAEQSPQLSSLENKAFRGRVERPRCSNADELTQEHQAPEFAALWFYLAKCSL